MKSAKAGTKSVPISGKEIAVDFQALFEAAPEPFLVLRPDSPKFTIVGVNEAYLQATMTKRDKIIGKGLFEVFPDNPDDTEATGTANLRTSLEQALKKRQPDTMAVQKYDIPRPKSEGGGFEVRYWSPLNTPVLDPKTGKPAYIIHRVQDVTEFMLLKQRGEQETKIAQELKSKTGEMEVEIYKRAQEIQEMNKQLQEANEKLSQLDSLKTQFFANVSHEFRTPLTLMLGPIEESLSAESAILPEEHVGRLKLIHRNALRLQGLVNLLLDFSRLEAGKVKMAYRPTDLTTFTSELASSFQSAMEKAGIEYKIDAKSMKNTVYVDRDSWEKIVLNLLSNALKFTFEGKVELAFKEVNGAAELSVSDTGSGIPNRALPHIFERFHRVQGIRSRTHEGSGIGLSLVYELVKLHGGKITVTSKVGKGSTFNIRLPLGKAHLPKDQIKPALKNHVQISDQSRKAVVEEAMQWVNEEDRPRETRASGNLGNETILVVDDNPDMREYIRRTLHKNSSWNVITAKNGREALQMVIAKRPDLILSDIMMPEMNGFELAKTIRRDSSLVHIPIIFLSARAGEEATVEGIGMGVDDYLTKPFSARELIARVNSHLSLGLLRQSEAKRLKALNETKDEFISIASHQLRTPATTVKQYLGMLLEGYAGQLDKKQYAALERAYKGNERQIKIIEELLNVARLDAGESTPKKSPTNLTELAKDIVDDLRPKLNEKNQKIALLAPKNDLSLPLDGKLMHMAIENLIDNAIKYTPDGKNITIELNELPDLITLAVKDEGVGIRPEDFSKLFTKFSRLQNPHSAKTTGSGIGLYWVKKVVDVHGGKIDVKSEMDKGTAFTISLPMDIKAGKPAQPVG